MIFDTKPHDAWRSRFALVPVRIDEDRWLWWAWYEWRWIKDSHTRFERRAVIDRKEVLFADTTDSGW